MVHDDIFRRFAQAVLPPSLSTSSMSNIQSLASQICVARGDMAHLDEEAMRYIVFLSQGAAKLVSHVGVDREQIVAFAFEGDLLVLSGAADASYALYCLTDCRLLSFPADKFFDAVAGSSDAAKAIFDHSLRAIDRSREKSVLLGRKTAQERIATFLTSIAERIGEPIGESISLTLPMSRREIADSLGLTIETVSRNLTELRETNLISVSGRSQIIILDVQRMRELAALTPCPA